MGVIVLTTYDRDEDIEQALKAVAKVYLLKSPDPHDLVQCIRDVHAGIISVAPAVIAKLATRLTRVQLTTRELEVLKLIARYARISPYSRASSSQKGNERYGEKKSSSFAIDSSGRSERIAPKRSSAFTTEHSRI